MDTRLFKEALFEQEFRTNIEDGNIFSMFSTKVVANAKNILSPFTSVGAAKAYMTDCIVPISDLTVGVDELILDRHIGNSIVDCDESWTYAKFDVNLAARLDLYASINVKANELALSDILADATTVAGTVPLATADNVNDFLIKVKQAANQIVSVKQKVDGATIKRSPIAGKPFIAAGGDAYRKILSKVTSIVNTNNSFVTTVGNDTKNVIELPYGVYLLDLSGVTGVNANQLIYGVAGVPTLGYREDKIKVDMGRVVSVGTFVPAVSDLDLDQGDAILSDQYYIKAVTVGRNGIFSNVASLVNKQLAA
jgi:hypothetical protein